jgi:hypothetical protein
VTNKSTKPIPAKKKPAPVISPTQILETVLVYGIATSFSKDGFGPISRADVLQMILMKHLNVDQRGHIILEVGADRLKLSIVLSSASVADSVLRMSRSNPGQLTMQINGACEYLNRQDIKKKFMSLKGRHSANFSLKGNSILKWG